MDDNQQSPTIIPSSQETVLYPAASEPNTKSKNQLSSVEVEQSRNIANVRISWQRWTKLCVLLVPNQCVWLSSAITIVIIAMLCLFPFLLHWSSFIQSGQYQYLHLGREYNREETTDICKWGCCTHHISLLWILAVTVQWQLCIITCFIAASWTLLLDPWMFHCKMVVEITADLHVFHAVCVLT